MGGGEKEVGVRTGEEGKRRGRGEAGEGKGSLGLAVDVEMFLLIVYFLVIRFYLSACSPWYVSSISTLRLSFIRNRYLPAFLLALKLHYSIFYSLWMSLSLRFVISLYEIITAIIIKPSITSFL